MASVCSIKQCEIYIMFSVSVVEENQQNASHLPMPLISKQIKPTRQEWAVPIFRSPSTSRLSGLIVFCGCMAISETLTIPLPLPPDNLDLPSTSSLNICLINNQYAYGAQHMHSPCLLIDWKSGRQVYLIRLSFSMSIISKGLFEVWIYQFNLFIFYMKLMFPAT